MKFLYVIESEAQLVKIGVAKDVEKRKATLEATGGHALTLIQSFGPFTQATKIEAKAHQTLASHRMKGEWFSCSVTEALAAVSEALKTVPHVSESPAPESSDPPGWDLINSLLIAPMMKRVEAIEALAQPNPR
ncbi:GIY-YIG nuclease family protein [Acidovorax sp. SD340]|uniref:GIY-YIG nuclease family protein n=1 Tax=Acidovorax sp. SD340 TaxID=1690268 RepID=UPI0006DD10CE|nr:GIY-YIG nuclease family protein [Acidovorax sp. SD340]KQB59371.1 hypothetical protein AE621_10665 [Acidovorax sp. SD340]MBO1007083.1 GIY-YIG nuclease family protein [Acidovorax sp. SD340]